MGYILPINNWTYHQYHLRTLVKGEENHSVKRAMIVSPVTFDNVLERKMFKNIQATKETEPITNEHKFISEIKGTTINRLV